MKKIIGLVLAGLVLMSGCIQTFEQSAGATATCSDGSVVTNLGECPNNNELEVGLPPAPPNDVGEDAPPELPL